MKENKDKDKSIDPYSAEAAYHILSELSLMDDEDVVVDGKKMKASQCFRLELDPPHVLFNTNCPEDLKERVNALLSKYFPSNESGAS